MTEKNAHWDIDHTNKINNKINDLENHEPNFEAKMHL